MFGKATKNQTWILLLPFVSIIIAMLACDSESVPTKTKGAKIDPRNSTETQGVNKTIPDSTSTSLLDDAITETPKPGAIENTPIGYASVNAASVNLRSGPGTEFAIIDNAKKDDKLPVYGQNEDGSWLQIDPYGTVWIKTSLVDLASESKIILTETAGALTGLLPGLQPSEVQEILTNIQITCDLLVTPTARNPYYYWSCKRESSILMRYVDIYSKSLFTVDFIQACIIQLDEPDDSLAIEFLGFIATLPYDGVEIEKAQAWIEQTLPKIKQKEDIRENIFGGIKLRLYGHSSPRCIMIGEDLIYP